MSAKTIEFLATLGTTLLIYTYNNFDIQEEHLTPTLENNIDPLRHLTSALVFPFQHGVIAQDLYVSKALWNQTDSMICSNMFFPLENSLSAL
jgi:hypothetical protein